MMCAFSVKLKVYWKTKCNGYNLQMSNILLKWSKIVSLNFKWNLMHVHIWTWLRLKSLLQVWNSIYFMISEHFKGHFTKCGNHDHVFMGKLCLGFWLICKVSSKNILFLPINGIIWSFLILEMFRCDFSSEIATTRGIFYLICMLRNQIYFWTKYKWLIQ